MPLATANQVIEASLLGPNWRMEATCHAARTSRWRRFFIFFVWAALDWPYSQVIWTILYNYIVSYIYNFIYIYINLSLLNMFKPPPKQRASPCDVGHAPLDLYCGLDGLDFTWLLKKAVLHFSSDSFLDSQVGALIICCMYIMYILLAVYHSIHHVTWNQHVSWAGGQRTLQHGKSVGLRCRKFVADLVAKFVTLWYLSLRPDTCLSPDTRYMFTYL